MKKLLLLFALLQIFIPVKSQSIQPQVLATSGDYFTSASIKLNWTLGEPIIETFSAGSYHLTQGFQQNDFKLSVVEENELGKLITVFPNPVIDNITIKSEISSMVFLKLFDVQGRGIIELELDGTEKTIDFSSLPQGIFILKIFKKSKPIKTIKIEKL